MPTYYGYKYYMSEVTMTKSPKYTETFCSQCGGAFGPGDSGFSHCDQHQGLTNLDDMEFDALTASE